MKNSIVRAAGLQIRNQRIRDAVLNGVPKTGPPTLRSRWARSRYVSPEGINEAFSLAKEIVDKEAANHKSAAGEVEKELKSATGEEQRAELAKNLEHHLVKSEFHNPEVRFNFMVKDSVDLNEPIYRYLSRTEWAAKEMLILMQRLEQHHVIPDTMPTLDPRAQVDVQFVTPTMSSFEPGSFLSNEVCERRPRISIQEFEPIAKDSLYSVVIVNPDVPDLENDSFKTLLHYAAVNIRISNDAPEVNFAQATELADYLPPHPEKNAPAQRFCVWVFRQPARVEGAEISREGFDIRQFAGANNLEAVGAHMWRVRYDLTTDFIRAKYGLGPGSVYFRARTAKPEEALLHVRHRQKWEKFVETPSK